MRVVIRVDASIQVGTGHVMRCLTLAHQLRAAGCTVTFVSRETAGHLCDLIAQTGHEVWRMPDRSDWPGPHDPAALSEFDAHQTQKHLAGTSDPFDWLIVDHYGLGSEWEIRLRPYVRNILVIDDLGNRSHDCDVLLDPAYGETGEKYRDLLPSGTVTLCGSQYALLRPQFAETRRHLGAWTPLSENPLVHVFFGGNDPTGQTLRFSRLLLENFAHLKLRVAIGQSFAPTRSLEALAQAFPGRLEWRQGVADMAAHLADCSVAIGAPGTATWERACMGLPSAYLAMAANQVEILEQLAARGFCAYLGTCDAISDQAFVTGFTRFIQGESDLATMSALGREQFDGRGALRVTALLMNRRGM